MNKIFDVFTFAAVIAGIMVLSRPNSQGPSLIHEILNGYQGVILSATGSAPPGWSNVFG